MYFAIGIDISKNGNVSYKMNNGSNIDIYSIPSIKTDDMDTPKSLYIEEI